MSESATIHETIIAGAGPVGLFLACELALAGCSVLVLEQALDPASPFKHAPFGLRGLSIPTIESFDRRGLLKEIETFAASQAMPGTAHWMKQQRRSGGHFAGIPFFHDQIDTTRWSHRLPSPISNLAVEMAAIETVLTARAEELGVTIQRGAGVRDFTQSNDAVVVQTDDQTFQTQWLVGCDGARSAVRKSAGIGFTGTDPELTGYSVQVSLAGADALKPGRHYTDHGMYLFNPPDTIAIADFDSGAFHRSAAITREHIQSVLRKVSGTDVAVTKLSLATSWTDRAFQADTYRNGRVLLAGDAAHIHSPLGGQGLNLGLGDAMNLGWKLAAIIRGDAPPGLLESYERERHPIGANVLDWSRAQVVLMRPTPSSRALRAIVSDLADTSDGATYFAQRVWGVSLRDDLGGSHALVGYSTPDFVLKDGRRVADLLQTGKAFLLEFNAAASLQTLALRYSRTVRYVAADVQDGLGLQALLVRPDGVVAWAAGTVAEKNALDQAMALWFCENQQS